MRLANKRKQRIKIWIFSILIPLGILCGFVAKPSIHLIRTAGRDIDTIPSIASGYLDDASRLNLTPVAKVWDIPGDRKLAEQRLAALLKQARGQGLKISIGGARHTMGGQTLYPGGIVINMLPLNHLRLNRQRNILEVGAGALWKDILPYLDKHGRSVAVMQSNNSFSVGGSVSVNCHGWQRNRPPIASTVHSFRLMKADGKIVRCGRTVNRELFSLVLGGYGLFGVLLDLELHVVPNERYRLQQQIVPIGESLATFERMIEERPDVEIAYARMNVTPERLLREVIVNTFVCEAGEIPSLYDPSLIKIRRAIFRSSVGSDYGKTLRWSAETQLQPYLTNKPFSRNQLLNEGVEIFQNRSADSTDILQEYFIPKQRAASFVDRMRQSSKRKPRIS